MARTGQHPHGCEVKWNFAEPAPPRACLLPQPRRYMAQAGLLRSLRRARDLPALRALLATLRAGGALAQLVRRAGGCGKDNCAFAFQRPKRLKRLKRSQAVPVWSAGVEWRGAAGGSVPCLRACPRPGPTHLWPFPANRQRGAQPPEPWPTPPAPPAPTCNPLQAVSLERSPLSQAGGHADGT